MNIYCKYCNTKINKAEKYCPCCGAKVTSQTVFKLVKKRKLNTDSLFRFYLFWKFFEKW